MFLYTLFLLNNNYTYLQIQVTGWNGWCKSAAVAAPDRSCAIYPWTHTEIPSQLHKVRHADTTELTLPHLFLLLYSPTFLAIPLIDNFHKRMNKTFVT